VKSYRSDNQIIIEIVDNGEGIEAQHIPYLFDRFYRADSSRSRETGGTGLGLAIVKANVEAQGGKIEVFSKGKGEGTTFYLQLPF
jgi:signal transduction histidine kinase